MRKLLLLEFGAVLFFNFYNLVNLCGEDFTDFKYGIETTTLIESKKFQRVKRAC